MTLREGLADFFQKAADAFLAGDHVWLSKMYTYPLAVYLEGDIFIEKSPADTANLLARRREVALARGTTDIRATVLSIDPAKDARIPVRVDWTFLDATGKIIGVNELRYFCTVSSDMTPKIEMLEFLHRSVVDRRIQLH